MILLRICLSFNEEAEVWIEVLQVCFRFIEEAKTDAKAIACFLSASFVLKKLKTGLRLLQLYNGFLKRAMTG